MSAADPSSAPPAPAPAPLPPLKLLLLGDSGVGKTSLMTCFADDGSFSTSMISTAGVDCRVKALTLGAGQRVNVQIWDTAGQERFKTITRQSAPDSTRGRRAGRGRPRSLPAGASHACSAVCVCCVLCRYYRGAMGIMLVFDCTALSSFQHVDYWLQSIQQYAHSSVQLILVGNKCDMGEQRQVSSEQAQQLAAQHSVQYREASAKQNLNVTDSFTTLAQLVVDNIAAFQAANAHNKAAEGQGQGVINLAEKRRKKQQSRLQCSGHVCSR